jgi:dipeptidyl aminopeptidase/acylaminoacyl peptidase
MTSTSRRPARPDDLYRLAAPSDPQLSPDGRWVAFVVATVAPSFDGYRHAIWLASADGGTPARRLTAAGRHDTRPRFSPDGRTLAFLSDRRTIIEEEPKRAGDPHHPHDREDAVQVHLLPLDGPGEARRLTDLPRGVDDFAWSPDGRTLAVLSSSRAADHKTDARRRGKIDAAEPGQPPPSDYRFFDRLGYQLNGAGFVAGAEPGLWLVDAATGDPRLLERVPRGVATPAWSPDGTRIALTAPWRVDRDRLERSRVIAVDASTGVVTSVAERAGASYFGPAWLPDGRTIAVLGGPLPESGYRLDIRLFAADGSERTAGRDLSGRHDVMPASTMNSDVTPANEPGLWPAPDGRSILFRAPQRGAYELWRIGVDDGVLERLTDDRHYIASAAAVGLDDGAIRVAVIRATATSLPEVWLGELGGPDAGGGPLTLRRLTELNTGWHAEIEWREPIGRSWRGDGREIEGWLLAAGEGARPTVLEIHGGPHTLYGWAPMFEFQVLAGAGISVFYANPRGSEGYGRDFNMANLRDWGPGPMRDLLAGLDELVADGLADPDRLGVTGGSYGGYLTSWIVGHDARFRAAITCRSVNDLATLMLTGDLGGTEWAKVEFGAYPWEDPDFYREASPITHVEAIRTPLLVQHAERDLRTTMGQAELLFSALRRLRREVRLMRVPEDSHELTRSGTPFRRVENLVQVTAWFRHYLIDGRRGLPPVPRTSHGR